jgi:hypothetical protein
MTTGERAAVVPLLLVLAALFWPPWPHALIPAPCCLSVIAQEQHLPGRAPLCISTTTSGYLHQSSLFKPIIIILSAQLSRDMYDLHLDSDRQL